MSKLLVAGFVMFLAELAPVQRDPVEQILRDKLMLDLREALSPNELARLMKEGDALSDEDAARLALQ